MAQGRRGAGENGSGLGQRSAVLPRVGPVALGQRIVVSVEDPAEMCGH